MPLNHLILCHPLLLLPSIFPSRVFSNESVLHIWWPKYWSFSFGVSPCNEYSGLISFRVFNITLTRIVKMGTLVLLLILKRKHCFIFKFGIFCQLSDFPFTFHFQALEKEMATHSSVLAWRIPGTGQPGGLPSMGSHRVGHD